MMRVPGELLGNDTYQDRVAIGWLGGGSIEPERQREHDEQQGFGNHDADFRKEREPAAGAVVTGAGLPGSPESHQHPQEVRSPTGEQHEHQEVDERQDEIDLTGVRGGGWWQEASHDWKGTGRGSGV